MKLVKSSLLVKLVILILVVYATVTLVSLRKQITEKNEQEAILNSSIAATQQENNRIQDSIDALGTDAGVEAVARDKLGMVDEGDIVKTDGTYIYILRGSELIVMQADGADVTDVSNVFVGQDWEQTTTEDGQTHTQEKLPLELYLADGRAVVLSSYTDWTGSDTSSDELSGSGNNYVTVDIYDVSDRQTRRWSSRSGRTATRLPRAWSAACSTCARRIIPARRKRATRLRLLPGCMTGTRRRSCRATASASCRTTTP